MRALAWFVGLPVVAFAAIFLLFAAFRRIDVLFFLFFVGIPALVFWCSLVVATTTCARALDAGYPRLLGIPIAVMLLGSLTPGRYGQPLFYAGVAGLAFALAVPSAPASGRKYVYWAEFASLICLTILFLSAVLDLADYAHVLLGGQYSLSRTLLGPDLWSARRYWLMPFTSAGFIVLLIILLWRAQPHRAGPPHQR